MGQGTWLQVGLEQQDQEEAMRKKEGVTDSVKSGDAVADFPLDHLARLDEQLGRPKWVVPVRHDDDLERLVRASIRLCKEGVSRLGLIELEKSVLFHSRSGRDTEVEACQRFFREGLTLSFNRILTDDAVSTWKPDIQVPCCGNGELCYDSVHHNLLYSLYRETFTTTQFCWWSSVWPSWTRIGLFCWSCWPWSSTHCQGRAWSYR